MKHNANNVLNITKLCLNNFIARILDLYTYTTLHGHEHDISEPKHKYHILDAKLILKPSLFECFYLDDITLTL